VAEQARGLGTAPLGSSEDGPLWWGPQDHTVAVDTVLAAIDVGAAFIDTAPFYGWGRAEQVVAEALAQASRRPPVYTKCGTIRRGDSWFDDSSPTAIRADVLASLDRLGLDRLDVVQVHDPDPTTPIEVTWEALMGLAAEGLIGGAGLSNHDPDLMTRALTVGPVAVVQHQYSLLHRTPQRDGTITWCHDRSVPFLAWSPLASGFLASGFDLNQLHPTDLRRQLPWASTQAASTQQVTAWADTIAARLGVQRQDVAVSWLEDQGAIPIIGARTPTETQLISQPHTDLTQVDRDALPDITEGS
jgi:aryl-alcohol dehydrogenase-like predicted oxidoreductase